MGDHRVSFVATFESHGIKRTCDMWINWPAEYDAVDDRVIDFVRGAWNEAFAKYEEERDRYFAEARAKDAEKEERAELARLKAKYPAADKDET